MGLNPKQQRIVETLEGPLFVSAGAGSGKTFVLTQRIMHALRPGSKPRAQWADPNVPEPFLDSIDQVLAITFTDKAAGELKERVRAALVEEGLDAEAAKVDDAWISTIHGMCSRILRAHALDLGLDPAFGVAEYADDLKRAAVEHVVQRVSVEGAGEPGAYDELLHAFELEGGGTNGASSLVDVLGRVLSVASSAVGGLEACVPVVPAPSHVALMEAYREIAEVPSYANVEAAQVALGALDAYVASARDLPALRACHEACDKLSKKAGGMGKDEKAAVDAVRRERPLFFAEAYLAQRGAVLDQLMEVAAEVQREFDRLKAEKSLLDNDDLLTRAYDALRNDPLVRAEFAGRFKMVMVDEFQDTAQQQVELVQLLCSPDCRELCTVGDAQQSIYRFRGADVSVFRNKKRAVEQAGTVCSLDINYRSHADILGFADRIFEGGADNRLGRDFLHLDSCGEDDRKDARTLRCETTRRRQAVLAVGPKAQRAPQLAASIAARFARLRDEEGFAPGDMVILMKTLTEADVYARAVRAVGMPCVVSGGTTVFRDAPEVRVVSALLAFLANQNDGQNGLLPLLTSPMFGLGATELLALATHVDERAGIVDSRTLTGDVFLYGELLEAFGELPLVERAREVLRRALFRVGRDCMGDIARDVVHESGWLYRLEQSGLAQDRAVAANVLKALDIVDRESEGRESWPRVVARAFDAHVAHIKESPAALSGGDEDAVRIMTVHASKGLEFPVVAVVGCDAVRASSDRIKLLEHDGAMRLSVLPSRHELKSDEAFLETPKRSDDEEADDLDAFPATAFAAFDYMKRAGVALDFEETARLLYVAITRAREVVILAMGRAFSPELMPGHATSLVGEVLQRIIPTDPYNGLPDLTSTRLDFPDSIDGDFEFILLADQLKYPPKKKQGAQRILTAEEYGPAVPAVAGGASGAPGAGCDGCRVPDGDAAAVGAGAYERSFALVRPAVPAVRITAGERAPRASYSYSSISRELHDEAEDRSQLCVQADAGQLADEMDAPMAAGTCDAAARGVARAHGEGPADGDPTALGSVFHDACQWMVELGRDTVSTERLDALCRFWGCTSSQRERVEEALERWCTSRVRAEALAWPCVRAEVPFYSRGMDGLTEQFAPYAEGAIDLLCTDSANPARALVIDYKTGGREDETPEALQEKHRLQAEVYADVLHKRGFTDVELKFVRVEQVDPADPTQPQVVTYRL